VEASNIARRARAWRISSLRTQNKPELVMCSETPGVKPFASSRAGRARVRRVETQPPPRSGPPSIAPAGAGSAFPLTVRMGRRRLADRTMGFAACPRHATGGGAEAASTRRPNVNTFEHASVCQPGRMGLVRPLPGRDGVVGVPLAGGDQRCPRRSHRPLGRPAHAWPLYPYWPFSDAPWALSWSWELGAWPNRLLLWALLAGALLYGRYAGHSFVESFHYRLDRRIIRILQTGSDKGLSGT